ncbi:hypothetical protein J2Y46_002629 [Microbacterium sp. BE35]|uniref:hypothetical protein n=1 Tax=Microbacterium sp. BE35 TaxID=2817773 RepID=UPI00285D9E49|nr:hypothetical protein [Microbacterium sp. BE35]MDR7189803.1 hypothetical protein [Microbacterium sp. BE35]
MAHRTEIGRREPHDEKTPEQTIDWVVQDWDQNALRGIPQPPLASAIIDALVYKAYFEEAESALRWLDPEGGVQRRVLNGKVTE